MTRRAPHLRLVRNVPPPPETPPDESGLVALAQALYGTPPDLRTRAIADAIAEEVSDLRAISVMAPARVELALHVRFVEGVEHWVGYTKTAGRRAIFVTTYLIRPIGHELEMKIELPNGVTIDVQGMVAGVRAPETASSLPGMEVRLTSMSSADAELWRSTIEIASGDFWSTDVPIAIDA